MEREVGGGIGMGNTCKPMAVSFQCMTKPTTIKKIKKKKKLSQKKKKERKVNQLTEQCGIHQSYHISYFIILSSTWETKSCDSKAVFSSINRIHRSVDQ